MRRRAPRAACAARGLRIAVAFSLACGLGFGCDGATRDDAQDAALEVRAAALAERLAASPAPEGPGLVVRLAFGEEADLDLYVTDPLMDTVYFARHETRSGGRILADVRCDGASPRVEEVSFEAPPPGRYRVGIDLPRRCDGARDPAPYALAAWHGGRTHRAQGVVAYEHFEVVALEFDVAAASEARLAGEPPAVGKRLYDELCVSCHGVEGRGDGVASHDVLLRPRDFRLGAFKFDTDADWQRGTDADLANVIRHSPRAYGGSPLMPPWAHLSDDEVASLVAYIRWLQG